MAGLCEALIPDLSRYLVAREVSPDGVIDPSGRPIGTVELLLLSESGEQAYALISSGGFLGFGKDFRLVRRDALTIDRKRHSLRLEPAEFRRARCLSPHEVERVDLACRNPLELSQDMLLYGPPFP